MPNDRSRRAIPVPKARRVCGRLVFGAGAFMALASLAACSASSVEVSASPSYRTSAVSRGNLSQSVSFPAVLTYDHPFPVVYQGTASTGGGRGGAPASSGGVVTWMAPASSVLASGDVMYKVDNVPVVFLEGDAVLWRPLASGDTGADVLAVEKALQSLGYNWKRKVKVDTSYWSTTAAMVRDFETTYGLPITTTFPYRSVVMRPSDVIVTDEALKVGDKVSSGTTVMTVSDTARVATFSVAPADRASVSTGEDVTVRLPNGSSVAATIESISSGLDASTGAYAARAVLSGEAPGVGDKVDVTVKASVPLASDALLVPSTALVKRDDGTTIVRVVRDGGLVDVPVSVVATTNQQTAVTSDGLAEGDNVDVA